MVEVKWSIPKEKYTRNARYTSGGGRAGNFGYGFNSSMAGPYGPRMNTKHVVAPGGRGGFTSYGPTRSGYNAPGAGYGNGVGYGPTMNRGSYGSSSFQTNPTYSTSTVGTYGGALTSYGNPATGAYNNNLAPVRNMWGNGTIPYVGGNGSIIGYGGGAAWGLDHGSNN